MYKIFLGTTEDCQINVTCSICGFSVRKTNQQQVTKMEVNYMGQEMVAHYKLIKRALRLNPNNFFKSKF